jgi:hypothetical protein
MGDHVDIDEQFAAHSTTAIIVVSYFIVRPVRSCSPGLNVSSIAHQCWAIPRTWKHSTERV